VSVPSNAVQENGVGAVSDDELNTYVQVCNNLSAARAFIGVSNMTILLLGNTAPGDGGFGAFYWNGTSTNVDDGGLTTIRPTGTTVGAWLRDNGTVGTIPIATTVTLGGVIIGAGLMITPGGTLSAPGLSRAILTETGSTSEPISGMVSLPNPPTADVLVPVIIAGHTISYQSSISTLLTAPNATGGANGEGIFVTAGNGSTAGVGGVLVFSTGSGGSSGGGGNLVMQTGTGSGSQPGGTMAFTAGNGGTSGVGGTLAFTAGSGTGSGGGGAVAIAAGTAATTGGGGAMVLTTGNGGVSGGAGGSFELLLGSALSGNYAGGTLQFTAGSSTGIDGGGAVNINGGNSGGTGAGGYIVLQAGTAEGSAGAGGTITLAGGPGAGTSNGGDIFIAPGAAGSGGSNRRGLLFLQNVPTADPVVSGGAIWDFQGWAVFSETFVPQRVALQASVVLTSAQVLAIHTTPILVIPAPGAGYYIMVTSCSFALEYNSSAYVTTNPLELFYGVSGSQVACQGVSIGFMEGTVDLVWNNMYNTQGASGSGFTGTAIENFGIYVSALGNPSGGNSPIEVTVNYQVIPLPF
jgi:hypothetical protein